MKFGLFYELQLPRPWAEGDEHRLFKESLEQVELADRLGYHCAWEVEHHFLEEYSHSSAPEVFLGAASQRTRRIRLGHGIVLLPQAFNHSARVAERIATLDLVSDGRVEFGTGESSSEIELAGFGVERAEKRAQWEEAIDAVTRMFVEEPFAGYEGRFLTMPPRNVIPKPLQKPHPPLWVACGRPETFRLAGARGIGALSFGFLESSQAAELVQTYQEALASDSCVPAGFAVNPEVAVVMPLMCHEDEGTAIDRGIDGAHFFGYGLGHYYLFGNHAPGRTSLADEFAERRSTFGFDRELAGEHAEELRIRMVEQAEQARLAAGAGVPEGFGDAMERFRQKASLRGAVGTPDQIRRLIREYEQAGVDQIIFITQSGWNRHEHVCESLGLFAERVMPEFLEDEDERERRKLERLGPAIEAALARRPPPRAAPDGYAVAAAAQA